MKKETLVTGGAIGASLLIASCCVAPALILLFGVSAGALGSLTALEPFRPYFIALGGFALLYSGRKIYRRAPAGGGPACEGDTCSPESSSVRRTRKLYLVAVVLFVGSIVYPWVIGALVA